MTTFRTFLLSSSFALICAGCTTPLIDIHVGTVDSSGSGGACRPPAICSGGAKIKPGNTGKVTKVGTAYAILDDDSQQVEHFVVPDPRITIIPKDATLEPGSNVTIERKSGTVTITKK